MIERTPLLNLATHVILVFGLIIILVPIWLAFVAATQTLQAVNSAPVELWPGDQLWVNLQQAWVQSDFGPKFVNTLIVATGVVVEVGTMPALTLDEERDAVPRRGHPDAGRILRTRKT